MPRPDTCTTEKIEAFVEALCETGMVRKACEAAGISRRTAFYWRTTRADFCLAWDEALKVAVTKLEDEALRRAQEGTEKPVYQNGALVGTVTEYSDTLTIFLLKAMDPNKYRERVALTGEDGGPMRAEVVIRHMFKPPGEDGGSSAP